MEISKEDIQKYVDIAESEGKKVTYEEAEVSLRSLINFIKIVTKI